MIMDYDDRPQKAECTAWWKRHRDSCPVLSHIAVKALVFCFIYHRIPFGTCIFPPLGGCCANSAVLRIMLASAWDSPASCLQSANLFIRYFIYHTLIPFVISWLRVLPREWAALVVIGVVNECAGSPFVTSPENPRRGQ